MSVSAEVASSPDVGSSRKSTEGAVTSSLATAVRLRSPPEIPRMPMLPMNCDRRDREGVKRSGGELEGEEEGEGQREACTRWDERSL